MSIEACIVKQVKDFTMEIHCLFFLICLVENLYYFIALCLKIWIFYEFSSDC
jgi:hypothetical protein